MLSKEDIIEYYSKKDVLNEIVRCSKNKEVVGSYNNLGYAKRPDTIKYPQEIIEQVKNGITSFHFSEESWNNIYDINSDLEKKELDKLRTGWDLIIDIDSKDFEISKITANIIIKAIKYHDLKSVSCKFSGNKGFHIAVPYEAFPKNINNKETRLLFPELPRMIAEYISYMIKDKVEAELIQKFDLGMPSKLKEFQEKLNIPLNELIIQNSLNIDKIIAIDTILINTRHLCRMPYSLNEKSGLVSIPVDTDKIMTFDREKARPENVNVEKNKFLFRENADENEGRQLILQAIDFFNSKHKNTGFEIKSKENDKPKNYDETKYTESIKVVRESFPPCINNILNGLNDGRKRGLFLLMNFLSTSNYDTDEIKKMIFEWNAKNFEPIRETYIKGQLSYLKKMKKTPPNCTNPLYKEIGACTPDKLCERIKNPIGYAIKKHLLITSTNEAQQKDKELKAKRKEKLKLKQKKNEESKQK